MLGISMEQYVQKLVEQAPAIGALVIIVMLFLRHIRSDREQQNRFFDQLQASQNRVFEQMHSDNMTARGETRSAIERNSNTITENVRVTTRNTETIERLARAIERCEIKTAS